MSNKRVMRKDMNKVERAILDHSGNACDYCTNPKMVKVAIHNKHWLLCYDCALEHADRFDLNAEEIHKIARENNISLSEG